MNFEQWQATRTPVTSNDNRDFADTCGEDSTGFMYQGGFFISNCGDGFSLVIGNGEWVGPNLATLEHVLFDHIQGA